MYHKISKMTEPKFQLAIFMSFVIKKSRPVYVLQNYIQQHKKRENLLLLNWLKIKYVEFKKCMLHVKLTV